MIVKNGFRFAVKIDCNDGRSWFAVGNDLNVGLFMTRGEARTFTGELRKHLSKKTKLTVVKVFYRIEEIEA